MVAASILTMVGLGIFFAGVLIFADRKLKVDEDPRVEELSQKLPGLNCGACGFPSCRMFAEGIVGRKEEAINSMCRIAGPELAELIAKIAGVTTEIAKEVAVVYCGAKTKDKTKKAAYKGVATCGSANIIFDGGMNCEYGCLGFGDCGKACPFDAIEMEDGLPKVDPYKCVACGKCVKVCPRNIMGLMPFNIDDLVIPACKSKNKGAVVRKMCSVGCIGCKICEKLSGGVFYVEEDHSKIKSERIKEDVKWDEIIKKCPTKTIVRLKG
ncbi:MAG: 4Fe-4S binding protein [Candidatus Omnitrophica bacterium]|nr:4Fe-4S binding protein [Candidatus Omnitrophota bacterium]